jgi:hypothetical protein
MQVSTPQQLSSQLLSLSSGSARATAPATSTLPTRTLWSSRSTRSWALGTELHALLLCMGSSNHLGAYAKYTEELLATGRVGYKTIDGALVALQLRNSHQSRDYPFSRDR